MCIACTDIENFLSRTCHALGLVRRVRTLTLKLLPVEVPPDSINDPTSRVITPQVIDGYIAAAGDFFEVVSTIHISITCGTLAT